MKSSLVLAGLLLLASCAQAQHSHMALTGGNSTSVNNVGGWGSGSPLGSSSFSGGGNRTVSYEDPRSFGIEYVRNDGEWVPSTYMSYEQALALGRQQLAAAVKAEQGGGTVSLGEVARAYRTVKVPTMKLQSRVLQDNSGRLAVCNLNGNDCHRP